MQPNILELFDRVTILEDFAQLLEKTTLSNCTLDIENKSINLTLESTVYIPYQPFDAFIAMAKEAYGVDEINTEILYTGVNFSKDYFDGLKARFLEKNGRVRPFIASCTADIENNTLKVSNINGGENLLLESHFDLFLKQALQRELGLDVTVSLNCAEVSDEEYIQRQVEEEKKLVEQAVQKQAEENANTYGLIFGNSKIQRGTTPIVSLNENIGICAILGRVIDFEVRETKKSRFGTTNTIITFDLADEDWAVGCKIFANTDKTGKILKCMSKGARMLVEGKYEIDDFSHKPVFTVSAVENLEPLSVRPDNAEVKRVELHMHTKMSQMDAVTSASDLISRAAKWGHPAIAITDHGVAQAFPEARAAAVKMKKSGKDIKVIYGIEGYLIDDIDSAKLNAIDELKKGTYVVFDIETTGLSPENNQITEIGAIKIVNGRMKEKFSQLINPGVPIPKDIVELTGITDEMVKDKPDIDTVLPRFLNFCKGATVVAHNASFDTSFISAQAKRLHLPFDNPIMDTLKMSRDIYPEEKVHKLNVVAQRLGISLENHHRAVDDATATAKIFIKFMEMTDWRDAAVMEKEIQPPDADDPCVKNRKYHIILLAQNYEGLKNLYTLISKSNLEYFYRRPGIPKSLLYKYREGIIVGSACEAGELFRKMIDGVDEAQLYEVAKFYDYLEIQPIGNNMFMLREGQVSNEEGLRDFNRRILEIGDAVGRKTVATCDVHFMDPEDEVYRRVLMGAQGFEDADNQAPLFLRTTEEMLEEFSYLGDERALEVVVTNTNAIADTIDNIQPVKDGSYPPTIENCEQDLVDMCHKKAHAIYGDTLPKIVQERMDRELGCITKYGYSVMYMIAHKLVKKSNEAGYLVGSRGSVGSSFAAFLADITEVNALCPHYVCPDCKYSEFYENGEYPTGMDMPNKECPHCGAPLKKDGLTIPFETFLGFEGDKVPDIDLNFSGEYQATAHKYVGELFGDEYVFKAGTIGTIAEKTAYGFAKKYYEQKGIEAPDAELKRVSVGMIDVKRTTGQHPGGIIVCPKTMNIHDFCPVQHPADKKDSDIITTHFDFHSIHDNLLKLDILGHDDPSTIRMLEDLTGVNALEIPFDDEKAMSIFSGTEALGVTKEQIGSEVGTFGVPEFGTNFVRQMLVDTRPTTFVELLIISGLSHGTDVWLNNAQDLVRNKIATLSEVIGLRDDIMVYLLQHGLEPKMAFNIMEFVRKGRAAKEGMPPDFESAMLENGVDDWYIDSCKKIKYMFPKAHAAAYVMMAFRVAYFKVHYPIDFYIAYYTVRADLFDAALMANGQKKVADEIRKITLKGNDVTANEKSILTILEICNEMYARGFNFLPVDLYESDAYKFKKVGNSILPPLNAFAGVGDSAAEAIVKAREEGKFLSQEDLKNRAGINKSVVEVLAENGVLKDLQESSQMNFFDMLM